MSRPRLIKALVAAQALLIAVLVGWAVYSAAPPDDPFSRLMQRVRDAGPIVAAQALGPDIQAAARGCPPDQLTLRLARARTEECRTLRAEPHQITIQCGARQLAVPIWADGFRATPTCPPFLSDL